MIRHLGIEPGEARVFAWGAAALFLVGWADVSVKNVAEVFFLKRVGVELMPLAFLASSVLLVATTWGVGRLAARRDRLRLLPRVFGALGLALLPLWLLVQTGFESAFGLLLIASKQITSIALLVFWIAMADLLHGRQSKRLFAPMMAGVTTGTIAGSFASKPLGAALGIDGLLPVAALAMAAGAAASRQLCRLRPCFERVYAKPVSAEREASQGEEAHAGFQRLWSDHPLFRLLLLTTLCSGLLGPMLYFQFQYVADLATLGQGGEQKLLAFYAQFRGWIYGAVLVVQLLASGRLYRRIGLPLAAAISPMAYLAGFVGLSVRLSLPAGVAAMSATKLQDEAVYDPALRVLYGLLPESIRARATALIEGPVKRAGGAAGNTVIVLALLVGSAAWVGYLALPIAGFWLLVALLLWRRYPRLLLEAAAARDLKREELEDELLDPVTVRALLPEICGQDPARARLAIELVADADPELAVKTFAEALARAPAVTRPAIVAALDRRLEETVASPFACPQAARLLVAPLESSAGLGAEERADLVQAYNRLENGAQAITVLQRALGDPSGAVRLAALSALVRRGARAPGHPDLDRALAEALRSADPSLRRTAREELRSLLLAGTDDPAWGARLELLVTAFGEGVDRAEVAEAVAEVTARDGARSIDAARRLLRERDDPQPRVRAALMRLAGHAGLEEHLPWLLEGLGSARPECAAAAREGLRALGPATSNALLRELSYGKRSQREAIIEVMRELDVRPGELAQLYERELDGVERDLVRLLVVKDRPPLALLSQRLTERVQEALYTSLMFLAAIRDEDRIVELGERLRQVWQRPRQRAIVTEALESLLQPADRRRLLALLEDADVKVVSHRLARDPALGVEQVLGELAEDTDEVTRTVAEGLLVAAGRPGEESEAVNTVEKMAHLKKISLFEDLTARQLMELARAANEKRFEAEEVVVRQGEYDDCLYLVVDGVVCIRRGDSVLSELGPGSFFGEIALLEGVARSADAVTRTRARLLGLERADLMKLIEESPGIAVGLLRTLSRRVRDLTDRLTA